ncbi:MAG: protein kinase [Caldilineaceae bacterium]|nr:protein kinase [Caldilineaceae bacterium]
MGTHLQNGKFTLGRVLGEGGFGITYLGAHRYLRRTVAIKELFPERAIRHGTTVSVPDSQQRDFHMEKERVLEEARALTRLDSPHIVEVQDAFLENNTAYIVMEYLEGESLQERIDTVGSLPSDDVRRIAMAACDALAEVHRQDLLHRDIKPANIMLTRDERVVLVDFGSARSFNHGQTVRHTRILTMDYAAPEMYSTQARFGPYTDLFCLGGTLYHALTGRLPSAVMDRLQGAGPDLDFSEVAPDRLAAAIRQALQIAVEDRPQSAADFKAVCAGIAVPRPTEQTASDPPQLSLKATTAIGLKVRSGPGAAHSIVGIVPRGSTTRYDILGKNAAKPTWYQIRLSSTVAGWVYRAFVQTRGDLSGLAVTCPAPASASGPQLSLSRKRRHRGTRHRAPASGSQLSLSLKATTATGLNVRSGPGMAHSIVGTIPRGSTTRYDILGKNAAKPTWYQIRLSSTVAGWVYRAFVQTRGDLSGLAVTCRPAPAPASGPQLSLKATTATGLKVRSGPGATHSIVGTAPRGSTTRYDILGKDAVFPTWWQIQYSNTVTGWVVANYFVQIHGDISSVPIPGQSHFIG